MSSITLKQSSDESPAIGALLRLAWQQIRHRIYEGVRNEGYTDLKPAHVAMFRHEGLDGRRPTKLAEQMQITKQSVNDLLRHLEEYGYIKLRQDPADTRARLIHLTARGRQFEAAVRRQAGAAEQDLAERIGGRRFKQFHETLVQIAGLVDEA
jgi:DNA-binding MarR family transcriptional regulator